MTNPTIRPIEDTERELLAQYKALETHLPPEERARLKLYARAYSNYRLGLLAKRLWDANQFSSARELSMLVKENP